MKWDDLNDDQFDLTGSATGWGVNLSSNLKIGRSTWSAARSSTARASQNY